MLNLSSLFALFFFFFLPEFVLYNGFKVDSMKVTKTTLTLVKLYDLTFFPNSKLSSSSYEYFAISPMKNETKFECEFNFEFQFILKFEFGFELIIDETAWCRYCNISDLLDKETSFM